MSKLKCFHVRWVMGDVQNARFLSLSQVATQKIWEDSNSNDKRNANSRNEKDDVCDHLPLVLDPSTREEMM